MAFVKLDVVNDVERFAVAVRLKGALCYLAYIVSYTSYMKNDK